MWGRIADCLMHSGAMNPVLYFDELDKVSTTPHGEEIVSMLIHLTDRSQNTQFHDRYFSGIDFDVSQCLFVFSFNDIDKVHPILRDRMNVINCAGYNETVKRLKFKEDDVILDDSAITLLILDHSVDEKGVRHLIRTVETMMTRLNMLRVADDESMKEYCFYMKVKFPLTIDRNVAQVLLTDIDKKEKEIWRSLYT
jgi:ATP-dependent Lon protease